MELVNVIQYCKVSTIYQEQYFAPNTTSIKLNLIDAGQHGCQVRLSTLLFVDFPNQIHLIIIKSLCGTYSKYDLLKTTLNVSAGIEYLSS